MPGTNKKFHHTSTVVGIVGGLPPSTARVMAALLRVYARQGRATMREVAVEADRALVITSRHLHILQKLGLVECTAEKVATPDLMRGSYVMRGGVLRPLVRPVTIRR